MHASATHRKTLRWISYYQNNAKRCTRLHCHILAYRGGTAHVGFCRRRRYRMICAVAENLQYPSRYAHCTRNSYRRTHPGMITLLKMLSSYCSVPGITLFIDTGPG
eukprot:1682751-Rhodomonas_salina.2